MKRCPEAVIGHWKHGVLSLNEKITKNTLLRMLCGKMFPLDWNPSNLWLKSYFKFMFFIQFFAMKTPASKTLFKKVAGLYFATLLRLRRNSATGVFLWILWNVVEHLLIEHLQVTDFKMSRDDLEKCFLL